MSTLKKLSLSGFKSTFKRKTTRGGSKNIPVDDGIGTVQRTPKQDGFVCDNDGSTTNNRCRNVMVEDKSGNLIIENGNADKSETLESNTDNSGLRQHRPSVELCDNANGNPVNIVNVNGFGVAESMSEPTITTEPGSAVNGVDALDSTIAKDPNPKATKKNGLVLGHGNELARNVNESNYVSPRASRSSLTLSLSLPPQAGNCHTFIQEVGNVRHVHGHNYINDGIVGQDTQGHSGSATCKVGDECSKNTSEVQGMKEPHLQEKYHPHCHANDNVAKNVELNGDVGYCAQSSDENINGIPIPPRPHRRKNGPCPCQHAEQHVVSDDVDNSEIAMSEEDSPPPAIPPKPASLFTNGHWNFEKSSAPKPQPEEKKEKRVSVPEDEMPPRPPARMGTRIGVDISLPFYKQYLEQSEKYHPPPVYEAVQLDSSLCSGGLAGELSKLPRQPWYWGPMAQDEAEEKLEDASDGSFLVRDSSDERYLLTLSFKSNGRCLHTRIEHRNGLFSLNDSEGHTSVIELIHSAVKESQKGVFGYMNDSMGIQNYPARITQWVSRYSEVKSLQHLCRFVIRETYPRHHIRKLPLPKKINEYILENQY